MQEVKGDLIEMGLNGEFDLIAHGCNCEHNMGGGLAQTMAAVIPEAWEADLATPKGAEKLGSLSVAETENRAGGTLIVANLYTQIQGGGPTENDSQNIRLEAIDQATRELGRRMGHLRIGLPWIGAGIAGGNWEEIHNVLKKNLPQATVVEWAGAEEKPREN